MFLHKLTDIIASANQGDIKVCRMVVKGAKLFFLFKFTLSNSDIFGCGNKNDCLFV